MSVLRLSTLAAVLALVALGARAEDHNHTIALQGDADSGFTASLSSPDRTKVVHQFSGAFVDTFTFHFVGAGEAEFSLTHSASFSQLATQQIVFTKVTLNGVAGDITLPLSQSSTTFRYALSPETVPVNGTFQLVVEGYAGLLGSTGQPIAASYSGTMNVNVSAVPEPGSYALMLGGLGLLAWSKRRKA